MGQNNNVPGIYVITCTANGKRYIGSSRNTGRRKIEHFHFLRHGTHGNPHLQAAWNKYGQDAFNFAILEETSPDRNILVAREQYWMDTLNPEFNISKEANSPVYTDEVREKISLAGKRRFLDPSERKKKSEIMKRPEIRKILDDARSTPEVKAKFSRHGKNILSNPILKQRLIEGSKTPEARANLRDSLLRAWDNPERHIAASQAAKERMKNPKYKQAFINSTRTPEAIARRSERQKKAWQDPEKRARNLSGLRAYWDTKKRIYLCKICGKQIEGLASTKRTLCDDPKCRIESGRMSAQKARDKRKQNADSA